MKIISSSSTSTGFALVVLSDFSNIWLYPKESQTTYSSATEKLNAQRKSPAKKYSADSKIIWLLKIHGLLKLLTHFLKEDFKMQHRPRGTSWRCAVPFPSGCALRWTSTTHPLMARKLFTSAELWACWMNPWLNTWFVSINSAYRKPQRKVPKVSQDRSRKHLSQGNFHP